MFLYAVRDDAGRYAFYVDADDVDTNLTGWHFDYFTEIYHSVRPDMLMPYDTALNVIRGIGGKLVIYKVEEY